MFITGLASYNSRKNNYVYINVVVTHTQNTVKSKIIGPPAIFTNIKILSLFQARKEDLLISL